MSTNPRQRSYKPFILRIPGLLLLLGVALSLIGVLEYAVRTLTSVDGRTKVRHSHGDAILGRRLHDQHLHHRSSLFTPTVFTSSGPGAERNDVPKHSSLSHVVRQISGNVSLLQPTTTSDIPNISTDTAELPITYPISNVYLLTASTITIGYSTTQDGVPGIASTSSSTAFARLPNDYLQTASTSSTELPYRPILPSKTPPETASTSIFTYPSSISGPDFHPNTASTSSIGPVLATTAPGVYQQTASTSSVLEDYPSQSYIRTESTVSDRASLPPPGSSNNHYSATSSSPVYILATYTILSTITDVTTATASSAYFSVVTRVLVSSVISTGSLPIAGISPNSLQQGDSATTFAKTTVSNPLTSETPTSAQPSTRTTLFVSLALTTNPAGQVEKLSSAYTKVETIQPTASSSNSTFNGTPKVETIVITWPIWWVFAAGYLPLLIAILFKIFWSSVCFNVKLIEPFIHLSKPDGGLGSDALCSRYLSSDWMSDYIWSPFKKRWLTFWTSFVLLLVGFLAPLASEVLILDTHYECGYDPCWPPKLAVNKKILRLLQGLLSFVAIMTLILIMMLYRSTTGLYSNPSSIASIASLLHHPEVLDDFRSMMDSISSKELKTQLENKRYQMGTYERQDGVRRYGIIPAAQGYSHGWTQIVLDPGDKVIKPEKKRSHHVSNTMDIGFVLFISGVLGVLVAYYKDGSNSGFNRFFNSNTFGPRFFMSSLGTLIALYWKGIGRKVQTSTPYRRLITSPSTAKHSILFKQHSLPPLVMYHSLINGHFFAALIAFTTFLADILTITLTVVPFSPTEIYLELLICAYTSIAILSLMILVILGLLFWKRRLGEMPRKADTLAGVMSYLCDSHLLVNFEGCEMLGGRELDGRIGRIGMRFEFRRFVGVSGGKRWMVGWEDVVL